MVFSQEKRRIESQEWISLPNASSRPRDVAVNQTASHFPGR